MKRILVGIFGLFLLISTLTFTIFTQGSNKTETDFVVSMSVTYRNNNETAKWIFNEEDRTIGLFMNNSWQTTQLKNHSFSIERTTFDEDGNPIALLNFPKSELQPGENISYSLNYYVISNLRVLSSDIREDTSGTLNDIPLALVERYCGEADSWPITDSKLWQLASDIATNETNVMAIVKELVAWIKQRISYPHPGQPHKTLHELPLYPNETLEHGEGDCDDQAILFITLCRILGIPAYLQIGCIYDPTYFDDREYWNGHLRNVLKHMGWHGWAIAYIPPWGWLPVDLTYVLEGSDDLLNIIEKAAVISQRTLMYMNISELAYIASTRKEMEFIENNNFYVYTQNEIMQVFPNNPLSDLLNRQFFWILAAVLILVIATLAGKRILKLKGRITHRRQSPT